MNTYTVNNNFKVLKSSIRNIPWFLGILFCLISTMVSGECKRLIPIRVGGINTYIPVWPDGINSVAATSLVTDLSPTDGSTVTATNIDVSGCIGEGYKQLTINDTPVTIRPDHNFTNNQTLINGDNYISIVGSDVDGNYFSGDIFSWLPSAPSVMKDIVDSEALSNGNFVVIVQEGNYLYALLYDETNQLVRDPPYEKIYITDSAYYPHVSVTKTNDGGFIASWVREWNYNYYLKWQAFDSTGNRLQFEKELSSINRFKPVLSMAAYNKFVLSYRGSASGTLPPLYLKTYTYTSGEFISESAEIRVDSTGITSDAKDVATLTNSRFVYVWRDNANLIKAKVYAPGNTNPSVVKNEFAVT